MSKKFKNLTKETKDHIAEMYLSGKTIYDIRFQFNLFYEEIALTLRERNIPIRKAGKISRIFSDEKEIEIIEKYKNGRMIRSLSKEYDVDRSVIKSILIRNNIKLHDTSFFNIKKDINRQSICEKYLSGLSTVQISKQEKITPATVCRILKNNNIEIRYKKKNGKKSTSRSSFSESDVNDIVDMYSNQKMSVIKILKAKNSKTSTAEVTKILRANGVKLRSIAEQNTIYEIDSHYFDTIGKNQAYILGWLYTDGAIRTGVKKLMRIEIHKKDISLLEFMQKEMKSNSPLYHTNKNSVVFSTHDNKIVNKLIEIGLVENKSKVMKFPEIPKEFISYFLLGCFEGDGSIYISSNNSIGFSYACGSIDFSTKILEKFNEICSRNKSLIASALNNYKIDFHSIDDISNLFNYLYRDVEFFLPRKFLKFKEVFLSRFNSIRWRSDLKSETFKKIDFLSNQLDNQLPKHEKETNFNPH